jgi:hypothetical protein
MNIYVAPVYDDFPNTTKLNATSGSASCGDTVTPGGTLKISSTL